MAYLRLKVYERNGLINLRFALSYSGAVHLIDHDRHPVTVTALETLL